MDKTQILIVWCIIYFVGIKNVLRMIKAVQGRTQSETARLVSDWEQELKNKESK